MNKPIILHGDNHGQWDRLFRIIDENKMEDCTMIGVGDCGIGFTVREKQLRQFEYLNNFFKKRNINYLCIRGNHDDPSYFLGQYEYSNFKILPDYHTETLNGEKFLFVGGAVSIDRRLRVPNMNWWEGEEVYLDESKITDCDVLITHSAPSWNGPIDKESISNWCCEDSTLWEDCLKERKVITKLIQKCGAKRHYCGHFHNYSWVDFQECYSTILAIDQFKEHRN